MAYELAPHRPRRPRRRLRAALALAGAVALLCGVGAAGLGLWSYQSVRGAAAPARDAAERFLARLVNDDPAGAYVLLCAATRQRWPPPEFTRRVAAPPRLVRYEVRQVRVVTRGGRPRATVTVGLTRASGPPQTRAVPVERDDDDGWRVCGDPF